MKRKRKSAVAKASERSFPKAAEKTSAPINPMNSPEGPGRKKKNRQGVTRWFSYSELAVLAALSNDVNYVYAIAKIYETGQPQMLKACQKLHEGKLLTKTDTKKKNREVVLYELNEDGQELVGIMKSSDEFIKFDKWVKHQKKSGFQSVEGIQK